MENKEKNELEFLPPKPKFLCGCCGNKFRHVEVCKDGISRCRNCKRKMVTNPFYIPKEFQRRRDFVSKFNISNQEKQMLISKHMEEGCSHSIAIRKINIIEKGLIKCKMKKMQQEGISNQNSTILDKVSTKQKELVESLGMKNFHDRTKMEVKQK